jgi:hypothetical protein
MYLQRDEKPMAQAFLNYDDWSWQRRVFVDGRLCLDELDTSSSAISSPGPGSEEAG